MEFDDEAEFLTEEQIKAKKIADLKKKHTMNMDIDPFKKKAPPRKPTQAQKVVGNKANNLNEASFEEDEGFDQSSEFVPPEILMRERSLESEKKSLEKKTTEGEKTIDDQLLENSASLTQDSKG